MHEVTETPQELTDRLWAEYGEPGEPWPWPGVLIVKTPVSADDKRVAALLLELLRGRTSHSLRGSDE